jgi:TPR repeat protein
MYVKGEGVLQDVVKAERWLRKAADQEYSIAQRLLAYVLR